ncbi:SDR family NAD(P)-dependent oxidoreductase [Arthrobacter alpinus]|nr:SDR family NAD(P)-dependent oxidoreductase [Arthrobacter alpinus]
MRSGSEAMFVAKTAVITGAASGIGRATALLFARRGAAVVIGDIDPNAETVTAEIIAAGGRAIYVCTDVTDESSVAALASTAVEHFGSLDILVANAGIAEAKTPLHEMDVAHWQRVIDINLTGVALAGNTPFATCSTAVAGRSSMSRPSWDWWDRGTAPPIQQPRQPWPT